VFREERSWNYFTFGASATSRLAGDAVRVGFNASTDYTNPTLKSYVGKAGQNIYEGSRYESYMRLITLSAAYPGVLTKMAITYSLFVQYAGCGKLNSILRTCRKRECGGCDDAVQKNPNVKFHP
jgi:hypothetical protein